VQPAGCRSTAGRGLGPPGAGRMLTALAAGTSKRASGRGSRGPPRQRHDDVGRRVPSSGRRLFLGLPAREYQSGRVALQRTRQHLRPLNAEAHATVFNSGETCTRELWHPMQHAGPRISSAARAATGTASGLRQHSATSDRGILGQQCSGTAGRAPSGSDYGSAMRRIEFSAVSETASLTAAPGSTAIAAGVFNEAGKAPSVTPAAP
jgi:hypothetical protein